MTQLAHNVFFSLKDNSDEAVEKHLSECRKYLDNHDGALSFSVGVCEKVLIREVNRLFDASLHIVFADRDSHDKYQVHERHLKFIKDNQENWAKVEVCDSNLA